MQAAPVVPSRRQRTAGVRPPLHPALNWPARHHVLRRHLSSMQQRGSGKGRHDAHSPRCALSCGASGGPPPRHLPVSAGQTRCFSLSTANWQPRYEARDRPGGGGGAAGHQRASRAPANSTHGAAGPVRVSGSLPGQGGAANETGRGPAGPPLPSPCTAWRSRPATLRAPADRSRGMPLSEQPVEAGGPAHRSAARRCRHRCRIPHRPCLPACPRSLANTLNVVRRRLSQLQGEPHTAEDLAHFKARGRTSAARAGCTRWSPHVRLACSSDPAPSRPPPLRTAAAGPG